MKKQIGEEIFRKFFWIPVICGVLVVLYVIFFFQVEDMTLNNRSLHSFNDGWVLQMDGQEPKRVTLPYHYELPKNQVAMLSKQIPRKYWGKTISFLSADQYITVYIDGEEHYHFGTKDRRAFGKTPGSITNFVDIPKTMYGGMIMIEFRSPYNGYGGHIQSMTVGERQDCILQLLRSNMGNYICSFIMILSGICMIVLGILTRNFFDILRFKYDFVGRERIVKYVKKLSGIPFLGVMCFYLSFYYLIETKSLSIFYGKQTIYSVIVFIILMQLPIFLLEYYLHSECKGKALIYIRVLLCCSYVNCCVQIMLQIFNVYDFMDMVIFSHMLLVTTMIFLLILHISIVRKEMSIPNGLLFISYGFFVVGVFADIIRTYLFKVGDLGEFSRYGGTVYVVLMVIVQGIRISDMYAENDRIKAEALAQQVKMAEYQNKMLNNAKEDAEKAKNKALRLSKEAEAAKKESELANQAKSKFLANMSHEIRTPINAVLGMDEMILRECKEKSILGYAGDIQNAGRALLSLINDILDFSKIETGKMEIIPSKYSVSSLLNDLVNLVRTRMEEKNLQFKVEADGTIPDCLYGDETRIRQIIVNLLTNAAKYTHKGSVSLKVGWKQVGLEQMNLIVGVQDTGIGITEEGKQQLFDSFRRLDEKKNRNIEGTGLGLTITKQLLELMKGSIYVKSTYGEGSLFEVTIPQKIINMEAMGDFHQKYEESMQNQKVYQASFAAPNARILVVDDYVMNLNVIKGLLKMTKIQIDTATSGKECLIKIQKAEQPYDMVFMDHMMPEMDGIETLNKIKELDGNPYKDVPVVALTANAITGARENYLRAGFTDYLTKPIASDKLEGMLLKLLPKKYIEQPIEEEDKVSETVENETKQWMEQLEKMGFHMSDAVQYCGTEEIAYKIIGEFYHNLPERIARIEDDYAKEDWKDYTIQVHAMKSVSATIGQPDLSTDAKALEMAGKNEDISFIHEHHTPLIEAMNALLGRLKESLIFEQKESEPDDADFETLSDDDFHDILKKMGECAGDFDLSGIEECMKKMDHKQLASGMKLTEFCEQLQEAVDAFDYDAIEEAAKSM